MEIPLITPDSQRPVFTAQELPPAPPMSLNSPWVKSIQRMWPNANPELLSQHASHLQSNMMKMMSHQIAQDLKKARETARKMREALLG